MYELNEPIMEVMELMNNDVYFMEIVDDLVVINDNYHGLLIFEHNFAKIFQVELFEKLMIYSAFKHGKEILLFCPDNKCLVYVNIELRQKKVISLGKFEDDIFSTLYNWNDTNLMLSDYAGNIVKVDLDNAVLLNANPGDLTYQKLNEDIVKLKPFKICKVCGYENKAFINVADSKIRLIDYKKDIKMLSEFQREEFYDFDFAGNHMVKISENKAEVLFKNNCKIYRPSKQFHFLRGKIIIINQMNYLFLLSGDKTDINHIKIEKIKL